MQSTRSPVIVGIEVLVDLVAGAGTQDVGGPGDDVVQRVRGGTELAVDQRHAERIEAASAELGRHVGRVQAGIDRALLDLSHQLQWHFSQLLDLLLVREQLALGECADGVDNHLLLVGQGEIQGLLRVRSAVARSGAGGG